MIDKHEEKAPLNGKTVPVERRNEVRLAKDKVESIKEVAVTYKIASTKEELENAFSLVWNNYVETGLQRNDNIGIRFTKYHLLPTTKVFIANFHEALAQQQPEKFDGKKGKCVGTVTLIIDSPMGLPMEEFCADEVAGLRSPDRKLAEVVAFAVDPNYKNQKAFLHMFKLLFQYCELKGVTDVLCSVTPKHIRFYRKVMLFEPMGELKSYSAAYKLKVQAHKLDIVDVKRKAQEVYGGREFDADLPRFFFSETYHRKKGEGEPLSCEDIEYFIHERTNFLEEIKESDMQIFRTEYEEMGLRFPY